MGIKYDLHKSKSLENVMFLSIIRLLFEFVDITLRYGRISFSFNYSSWTLFFAIVLVTVAYSAISEGELACAVGVGGVAFMYYYLVIYGVLKMVEARSVGGLFAVIADLVIAIAASVLLAFMFGRIQGMLARLATFAALGVCAVYTVILLGSYFTVKTLSFAAVFDICTPIILVLISINARERR